MTEQTSSEQSPADRVESPMSSDAVGRLAAVDLDKVNQLLEQLWLERHLLYGALRALKIVQSNVELVRARHPRRGEP